MIVKTKIEMKILAVNRELKQPINDFVGVDVIPDSAMIQDGKPFFVPDFFNQWCYYAVLAFRVSRLGKNIATKFAHRYYDAVALAVRTSPVVTMPISTAVTTAFDGAFICGAWTQIDNLNENLRISIGDKSISISTANLLINDSVAYLSKYFTLKIGDIIIPAKISIESEIITDTVVVGKINENDCLKLKFK